MILLIEILKAFLLREDYEKMNEYVWKELIEKSHEDCGGMRLEFEQLSFV